MQNLLTKLRISKLFALLSLLALTGCGGPADLPPPISPPAIERPAQATPAQAQTADQTTTDQTIRAGKYGLQQASFDDGDGVYTLMLLDTPPGMPGMVKTKDLKMARLTEEEVKAGQKSYYQAESGSLHLAEDFRIDYSHNVTETRPDPQTGQSQTVVVRRETSFWSPFFGSLAGNVAGSALSNMLFRPQYYVPPIYQPGGMTGHGGYGQTYSQAVDNYRSRYNAPPIVERNRTTFRNSGTLPSRGNRLSAGKGGAFAPRSQGSGETVKQPGGFGSSRLKRNTATQPPLQRPAQRPAQRPSRATNRPTGSGFGSSRLRQTPQSRQPRMSRPARSSFGSSRRR